MFSLLIKDTTRAQREEIVRRSLNACGSPCDGCNGINAEYAASRKLIR